ncbi:hypothetical protein Cgig2_010992 [Carnegiea gigantea]|uniref:Peroxin-5 n=1 Tax=Carnegiea gigantea TaxID=171969 RepID=A0A9Q1JX92_9CARY|nr:hypothetical protein Cgig2_010992 [Carnegiea gigantea]
MGHSPKFSDLDLRLPGTNVHIGGCASATTAVAGAGHGAVERSKNNHSGFCANKASRPFFGAYCDFKSPSEMITKLSVKFKFESLSTEGTRSPDFKEFYKFYAYLYNCFNSYADPCCFVLSLVLYCKLIALDLKPNYVRAWANMGISYANQGMYDESIRYYVRALAMNPKADNAWQYLRISLRKNLDFIAQNWIRADVFCEIFAAVLQGMTCWRPATLITLIFSRRNFHSNSLLPSQDQEGGLMLNSRKILAP